jgi:hypothetical protein
MLAVFLFFILFELKEKREVKRRHDDRGYIRSQSLHSIFFFSFSLETNKRRLGDNREHSYII